MLCGLRRCRPQAGEDQLSEGALGENSEVLAMREEMGVMVGDRVRVLFGSEKGKYGASWTSSSLEP